MENGENNGDHNGLKARYQSLLDEFGQLEGAAEQAEKLTRQLLGKMSLAVDKAYPELEPDMQSLRDEVRQAAEGRLDWRALDRQVRDVIERIREIEANAGVEQPRTPKSMEPLVEERNEQTRRLLSVMLERIAFTAELEGRRGRLLETLADEGDVTVTSVLIDRAAMLVNDMRRQIESEKNDLASFLKQITQTLNDIDRHAAAELGRLDEQREASDELDKVVSEHVDGMHAEMDRAMDLNTLKTAVQSRLSRIRKHVAEHRVNELQRLEHAEEENARLRQHLKVMEGETEQLKENLAASHARMLRDALTGLPNRLAFEERARLELARYRREKAPLCLAVWDIDHFKHVNDSYGHKAGDKALHVVGRTLAKLVREVDMVARFGGEEFVMLLPQTPLENALPVVERMREKIAQTPFRYKDEPLKITLSCGITAYRDGETMEQTFERADQALYRAKDAGRNRCQAD